MNEQAAGRCLDALEAALQAEREALVTHNVGALMRANEEKLAALAALEADVPPAGTHPRIATLSALNQANGALLARRRREVDWALRHLGRVEATEFGYNGKGLRPARAVARPLASA